MPGHHYKSWSGLNRELQNRLCEPLKGRITYFLTRYHDVHNSYGRASIRPDGKELVEFGWIDMCRQDHDTNELYLKTGVWAYDSPELKEKWDRDATFSDMDFLYAATTFLQLGIGDALKSDNLLILVFSVLDSRVGKRTLEKIRKSEEFLRYPPWVKQFFDLRSDICGD